jgi:hypothetical protein
LLAFLLRQHQIKLSLWYKIAIPQNDTLEGLELGIGTYTPNVKGVAFNWIYSKTDNATAWQTGTVTITNSFKGLQSGFVNWNENEVSGVQWGFFNKAQSVKGLQFGFINVNPYRKYARYTNRSCKFY